MRLEITVPAVALEFDKALVRKILRQAGNEIKANARALIGRDASGRTYGQHIASGPDKPPASLTGRLAASLKVRQTGDRVTIFDVAESNGFYARFLETGAVGGGGPKGSKNIGREHKRGGAKGKPQTRRVMQPRPFLSTAAEEALPSLGTRISAALSRSIDLTALKATMR
jgi:hypothetical protein